MADKSYTYTSKTTGTKKWKAYAEDSCGNVDYGEWNYAGDASNKGPNYVFGTAGISVSQSNGVLSITGPSNRYNTTFVMQWSSAKVSGSHSLTITIDIPADPVPLIKKWRVGPGYMGAGIDVFFDLSDEAVANGVDPNDVTLWFSTARQEVTVVSQNGGCSARWGIQWQNRNDNYVDIIMDCSEASGGVTSGCFSLACVSGPYDLTNGDNSMLPTDRKWIMIQQNSQTIDGVQYKSYNGSVAVGIGYVNTFSGNCGTNEFVFMYILPQ